MSNPEILVGSMWEHRNSKTKYEVLVIANTKTNNIEKYPPIIVYRSTVNGNIWARKLNDWYRSMTQVS